MSAKPSPFAPDATETVAPDALRAEELPVARAHELVLPSGRAVEVSVAGGDERLRVVGRGGRVELTVVLTDAGPRLVFESAELELRSAGAVTVDCARFAVKAREEATLTAESVTVEATRGDVRVKANDAVALDGEEVRMNCDRPDDIPPWMRDALAAQFVSAPATPAADVQGDASLFEEFARKGGT